MQRILVVEDEVDIRSLISDILEDEGYEVLTAVDVKSALEVTDKHTLNAVVLDIWLENSDMDGIGLLKTFKKNIPDVPIIMISGHGNIDIAVQTIKFGAYDFIEKPFKSEKLLLILKRAIESQSLSSANNMLKNISNSPAFIGKSKLLLNAIENAKAVAPTNSRVFLTGEIGIGKGSFASYIHNMSKYSNKPFISFKITSKKPSELAAELFGTSSSQGIFEKISEGTIYIEEISKLPLALQADLLDALQNGYYYRNNIKILFQCRLITSSVQDLKNAPNFNLNLFSRISTDIIEIPALRARLQDIGDIAEFIMKQLSQDLQSPPKILSEEVMGIINEYRWPGNIRQLRNILEYFMLLSPNDTSIDFQIFSNILSLPQSSCAKNNELTAEQNFKEAKEVFERNYITKHLIRFNYNITEVAEHIDLDRTTLHRKIKKLGIL